MNADPALRGSQALHLGTPLRIGEMLVQTGLLTRAQAGEVARYSVEHQVRFGEAAVALKLVTTRDVDAALSARLSGHTIQAPARISEELLSYHRPDSVAAEDVRNLRNALTLRWFQHSQGGRALSVISPERGEGRSLAAANLAIAFAQVGVRTLLIDADMRHPAQHRLFGLNNRSGLSGYLASIGDQAAHYYIPGLEALTVIPVGALPPSPQELLLRPTVGTLFETALLNYEVVLVDTPAASTGSDYQIISRATRGALLVGRCRGTRMNDAAKMLAACEDIDVKVVGGAMLEQIPA